MLQMLGLEPERFALVWCSSAEAERFVAAVRQMSQTVERLGPSPYRAQGAPGAVADGKEAAACR